MSNLTYRKRIEEVKNDVQINEQCMVKLWKT